MEDRRTMRTKRAIRDAFIQLAKDKDVSKITVSELSELADLGRGTFYLHYKDVFDLQESLENAVLEDLMSLNRDALDAANRVNLLPLLEQVTEYMWNNKDILSMLFGTNGNVQFLQRFKNFFLEKVMADDDTGDTRYQLIYVISGCTGIVQDWVANDFQPSPKRLAEIVKKVIQH